MISSSLFDILSLSINLCLVKYNTVFVKVERIMQTEDNKTGGKNAQQLPSI